jgi:hypothetical protein
MVVLKGIAGVGSWRRWVSSGKKNSVLDIGMGMYATICGPEYKDLYCHCTSCFFMTICVPKALCFELSTILSM